MIVMIILFNLFIKCLATQLFNSPSPSDASYEASEP
ncbi:MAG: hypothetical protein QG579_392 [Patescibacteria group bacterium]|nr:hypothetical protein [Patescibacteria group bacterium]